MPLTSKTTAYATLGVMTSAALFAGSVAPAAADEEQVGSTNSAEVSSSELTGNNAGITEDIIEKYDEYVTSDDDGNFVLNLPDDFDADPDEVAIVRDSIQESNEAVHEQSSADEAAVEEFTADQELTTAAAAAGGGFNVHWWGTEIWLNGAATDNLNRLLIAGAGVSALTAAIMSWTGVGGAAAGVVAGAFSAAAGLSNLCNWNENGISIRAPFVGPVHCWPR